MEYTVQMLGSDVRILSAILASVLSIQPVAAFAQSAAGPVGTAASGPNTDAVYKSVTTSGAVTAGTLAGDGSAGITVATPAKTANIRNWLSGIPTQSQRFVFVGGAQNTGFENLGVPANVSQLLLTGAVGLYNHGGGITAAVANGAYPGLQSTWGLTGAPRAEHSYPTFTTSDPAATLFSNATIQTKLGQWGTDLGFNPGARITAVNININSGNFGVQGGGTTPSTSALSATDLTNFQNFAAAGQAAGYTVVAPVITPNGGTEPIDSWTANSFWDNARAAALAGGGLALDASPNYAMNTRGPAYMAFIVQQIQWCHQNNIRAHLIMQTPAPDATFLAKTQAWIAYLQANNALPDEYHVLDYSPNTGITNTINNSGVGADTIPGTVASVALWLAQNGAYYQPAGKTNFTLNDAQIPLPTTAAASQDHARWSASSANIDRLRLRHVRRSAGTDQATAQWRFQREVDGSLLGFLGFGADGAVVIGNGSGIVGLISDANGDVKLGKNFYQSFGLLSTSLSGGLTAAGSTQATALTLTANVNRFTTVAAGTGAILPVPTVSLGVGSSALVTVINDGANALSVYPSSGGTILQASAANAPILLGSGMSATFQYINATTWKVTNGLAQDYGNLTVNALNALTGVVNGARAFATNGRAQTGAAAGAVEAAGSGTGVAVTAYVSGGTTTWRIAGTTIAVSN